MFPIRDDNPAHRTPYVTVVLIVACVAVFLLVQPRGDQASFEFLYQRAAVSCEIVTGEPLTIEEIRSGICRDGAPGQEAFPSKSITVSVLTSIFLHAGLFHLGANMWSLWIFGNNVEDRMSHARYLLFYLGAGVVATLTFVFLRPGSTVPLIGASGAIAGVMGAYLVMFPRAAVITVVPPFFFFPFRVPAVLFLLVWFASQFMISSAEGAVAWEAHVGGFVAGVAYALLFRKSFRGSGRGRRAVR